MTRLNHVIATVLFSLAAISTAIPAKTTLLRSLRHELLSSSWPNSENIQRSPFVKSASRSRWVPIAKMSKAVTSVPGSDTYKGNPDAHAKSKRASSSSPQFDYMGTSKFLKSPDATDLTHPMYSNVNSRFHVSRSVVLPSSVRQGGGLTGDKCTTNDDCQGDRVCSEEFATNFGLRCSFPGGTALICDDISDCDSGELCVEGAGTTGSNLCLSSAFVDETNGDPSPSPGTNGDPSPSPGVGGGGLTGDKCTTTDDCQGDRVCNSNFADDLRCSFEGGDARICNATSVCAIGEVCVPNAGTTDSSLCLSSAFIEETQSGLTGDKCTTTADCQGGRVCSEDFGSGLGLRCSFEGGIPLICTVTSDCSIGEVCVRNLTSTGASLCLSTAFAVEAQHEDSLRSGAPARGGGLTGDKCTTNDDCQGDRVCSEEFATNFGLRCSFPGGTALICDDISDCDSGELCVEGAGTTGSNLCLSSAFVDETNGDPSPSPGVGGGGLTGDKCTTTDDCQGDRVCNEEFLTGFGLRCSFPGGTALICDDNSDCDIGEVCALGVGTTGSNLCLSSAFVAETQS